LIHKLAQKMMDQNSNRLLDKALETIDQKYAPLSEACKTDIKNCAIVKHYAPAETLVRQDQYADKLYFIIQGGVKIFYLKNGREIVDWFAFENEFFNAIVSFFQNIPSPHYIKSLENTTCLEMNREDVFRLSAQHHCFETLSRIAVTKTMLRLQQRVVSLQFETAQQKYLLLLEEHEDILQRLSLTDISSYLGITLETLSRIRKPKNRI
jgi:CRP-like cAMP-binding protein